MAYLDADVIMTATVLGFSAHRMVTGGGVRFDTEGFYMLPGESERAPSVRERAAKQRADVERLASVLDRVNAVLRGVSAGCVTQGTSPTYGHVDSVMAGVRHGDPRYPSSGMFERAVRELHALAVGEHEDPSFDLGYRGKGTYTGFLVPPPTRVLPGVTSTYAQKVPEDSNRWHPIGAVTVPQGGATPVVYTVGSGPDDKAAWGMLLSNKDQGPDGLLRTMASMPATLDVRAGDIVGYTHGMTQAIVKCLMSDDGSRPFEIAVGPTTTKLSSCFPCTLFMCASGLEPSSIHLGRSESWAPMYAVTPELWRAERVIQTATRAWHRFCSSCLSAGVASLQRSPSHVDVQHMPSLAALRRYMSDRASQADWAANLILDAVTIHDTETNRLDRTLK